MASLKQLIRDTKSLEEQISTLTQLYDASRRKIQEAFDKDKLTEIEVEPEDRNSGKTLIAKKTERATINYFADKLKENLDKEVCNEVIDKTYTVNDIVGMIALVKAAGVKPDEFKKFLNITAAVNKEKLKQLYSVGDITKEDIKGCYEATIVKSISIKYKKEG